MLDSLELELQVVLSHHVGAGNQIQVLWKTKQGFAELSSQIFLHFLIKILPAFLILYNLLVSIILYQVSFLSTVGH